MSLSSNENFKTKLPKLNPLSLEYKRFWKEEKKRCIEGYWSGDKFMPGLIYFYINYWTIELNKTSKSKQKSKASPFLRDLEWEKGYLWQEARGFSGFENGPVIPQNEIRKYLPGFHAAQLGKPLYLNDAKNVVDIEARGGGKSFLASAMIAHNFLFDGATEYDLNNPTKSETLVGAIDTKYSSGLLQKVQLGLNELIGSQEFNGVQYPSPLGKKWSGSFESGKAVKAVYDVKLDGQWVKRGSNSMIIHRTFADNPMAANGSRPSFSVIDEIGFMGNLIETLGQLKECTADGADKFGTIWMCGTGGDMAGGSTEAVKKVFYDPEAYSCLVFEDPWENRGKIGYFVPATRTLNQFKDSEGCTNNDLALNFLLTERAKLIAGKDKQPLYDELQNRPLNPSEAFLLHNGNIFPTKELKDHLIELEIDNDNKNSGVEGEIILNSKQEVEFKPYPLPSHKACQYPLYDKDNKEGCVVIWEMPEKNAPYGLYIGGTDPYDQDKAENSVSLGSTIIYKRFLNAGKTSHWPVAEYTGRPDMASEHYEIVRRLLLLYNAKTLYENEKVGIKMYFETKQSLRLLHAQPLIIKSISPTSNVNRGYGTHMTIQIKNQIETWTRDWLKTEIEPGILQLTKIRSIPLLKELIAYNVTGNFDRVIAFMLCMMQDLEMHKLVVQEAQEENIFDSFFTRKLFV